MGFHEKSAWASLIAVICAYLPYFFLVAQHPMAALGLFWVAAAGLGVVLAVFHIVNALVTRSIRLRGDTPPTDELDRLIELKAAKLSGIVLAAAVFCWILFSIYAIPVHLHAAGQAHATDVAQLQVPALTAMTAIHWLFAGWVIANAVYYGAIVAGYRRMALG